MKINKLGEILKKGNITIPLYVLELRDKLSLDMDNFIFLIYLSNLGDKVILDINKFSNDLNLSQQEVLSYLDNLSEKKLVSVDVIKNSKNVMEEYVVLDLYYEKLTNLLLDNINKEEVEEETNSSVFEMIEKEFARPLSPIEYEIVRAWIESGTSEELIKEALKEAVYSGVTNLNYIDKIIYEWSKKGIKNRTDIENNRKKFKENLEKREKLDLFEYDWFNENEDEE